MTSWMLTEAHHTPIHKSEHLSKLICKMIQAMVPEILEKIYEKVVQQNVDEIDVFKKEYMKTIEKFNCVGVKFSICADHEHKDVIQIDEFFHTYIYKTLQQEQVDAIICKYGITKALALLHDFHRIGLGDSDEEICEIIENPDLNADREMVGLIFQDAVEYHSDWRSNLDNN